MAVPPVEHARATLGEVELHYVSAGPKTAPPVLLVHGWPQSWYEWRDVMAGLSDSYRLVAPDMRGLGDSSRPATGYDTPTLAEDLRRLMAEHLGHRQFAVVGHDWGGPVAFALAAANRETVTGLAIIDVAIPGDGSASISQGGRRWHHAFHQTLELPEALVDGREAIYLGWFYDNYGATPEAISTEARREYLRTYCQPGAMSAGFAYYRNIPADIAHHERLLSEGGPLDMPVLALGGTGGWGRGMEVIDSCRRVARNVTGGVIDEAGHWLPEEQPERLVAALREFLPGCT